MEEYIKEPQDQFEQDLYEHFHFDADKKQGLLRIDKFLVNRIENISRTRIQSAIDAGNVLVNGKPVKSNHKVKPLDNISIVLAYPPKEIEIIPENIPIQIIYEDEDIIVVNKKAGMVVHPGHGNYRGTLVNALAWHLKDLPLFKSGELRPGLVHRIDKDTSGILVVAKNEIAMQKLARQFYEKTTKRIYITLVWGSFENDQGTIKGNIGRHLKDRMRMAVFPDENHGKSAVTHYKVIERFKYVTLLECRLETGRTHQIRVHLEYIKHPVFNDERYGGDSILKGNRSSKYSQFIQNCFEIIPRHALHAKSLGFIHPRTQVEMLFDSEIPEDMIAVIEKWRKYTN